MTHTYHTGQGIKPLGTSISSPVTNVNGWKENHGPPNGLGFTCSLLIQMVGSTRSIMEPAGTDKESGDPAMPVKRTQSTPSGVQLKPCSAGSKAHTQPGRAPHKKRQSDHGFAPGDFKGFLLILKYRESKIW